MTDEIPTPKSVADLQTEADARLRENSSPLQKPIAEMTTAEKVEYWRGKAEMHKARVDERADYDEVKRASDVLAYLRANGHMPAAEEESPDPPEAEAENEAWAVAQAERTELRRSALLGELVAATGHPAEFFDAYLPHVFVDQFFNDDGRINREAVQASAKHFTPKSQTPQSLSTWTHRVDDPVAAAMGRIGQADDPESAVGRAVAEAEERQRAAAERIKRGR